jgi:hypothetical protein
MLCQCYQNVIRLNWYGVVQLDFGHFRASIRTRRRFAQFQAICALASTESRELFSRKQPDVERSAKLAKVQIRKIRHKR